MEELSVRAVVHLALHVAVPLVVARALYAKQLRLAFAVMMATMLVDLDHLWAEPVYAPNRCSIGFHPLHTAPAMVVYVGLMLWPRARWVGLGLVIHMILDGIDCGWMRLTWT